MDKISIVLASIMGLLMAFMIAPSVLAMNQGKILRNIALWLAIFMGLAIVYRTTHPQVQPTEQSDEQPDQIVNPLKDPFKEKTETESDADSTPNASGIFMPPSE